MPRAIAEVLHKKYSYDIESISGPKTLSALRTLLFHTLPRRFTDVAEKQRRLIFYYAGHGKAVDGDDDPRGYLVPQDADPQDMDNTCMPMEELYDGLKALACHHMLVILDCCFAGSFRWIRTRDIGAPDAIHKERFDRYLEQKAWQALTSASYNQKAFDLLNNRDTSQDGEHSPFANLLIKALSYMSADYTKNGITTAHELYFFLDQNLSDKTQHLLNPQKPGLWPLLPDDGEFIFLSDDFNRDTLPDAPELNEENNPYRGLKAYDEKNRDLFFGWEHTTKTLYDKVAKGTSPLTVVVGISGCGKSSLVCAGLIPKIRKADAVWHIVGPLRPSGLQMKHPGPHQTPDALTPLWADSLEEAIRRTPTNTAQLIRPWLRRG